MYSISKYFLALSLLFCIVIEVSAQEGDVVQKGQQIPEFNLISISGDTIRSMDLKGKVVLINFFATWCKPCLMELPHVQKDVWDKYGKRTDFSLLVIGRGHDASEIIKFQKKYEFDLPLFPDKDKNIYKLFADKYIPRNYIIDKDGKVVYLSTGYTEQEFELMLEKLNKLLD